MFTSVTIVFFLKMGKRFCLENTVGFNDTHKASLNYNKDQGLNRKVGHRGASGSPGSVLLQVWHNDEEQPGYRGQAVSQDSQHPLFSPVLTIDLILSYTLE